MTQYHQRNKKHIVVQTEGSPLIQINIFCGKHQCLNRESASVTETPRKSALQARVRCKLMLNIWWQRARKMTSSFIQELELRVIACLRHILRMYLAVFSWHLADHPFLLNAHKVHLLLLLLLLRNFRFVVHLVS